jgi:hypothetical protein
MKKYLSIIPATLLLTAILFSCKKSSSSAPPPASKDYAESIKNKTWSGALTYTGQTTEYYSVHFNADKTLLWSQMSGDYAGHWAVNDKTLTMTFDANTAQIKAMVTEDNKFSDISDNTGYYEINSGELIVNPDLPIDNTIWKGALVPPGNSYSLQLNFMPGLKIEAKGLNTQTVVYARSSSGAVIRAYKAGLVLLYFGIITSAGEMKGSYDGNTYYPWYATKQ